MNPFWPSLGAWAYFAHKARKEKPKEDAIYDRAIRDAVEEHSSEQADYDKWVKSLPTIYGPSGFNLRANTHFADEGVIDMYAEYLERQFELDQAFVSVLELEKDNVQRRWTRVITAPVHTAIHQTPPTQRPNKVRSSMRKLIGTRKTLNDSGIHALVSRDDYQLLELFNLNRRVRLARPAIAMRTKWNQINSWINDSLVFHEMDQGSVVNLNRKPSTGQAIVVRCVEARNPFHWGIAAVANKRTTNTFKPSAP
jgi:hypothetical protein